MPSFGKRNELGHFLLQQGTCSNSVHGYQKLNIKCLPAPKMQKVE